MTRKERAITNLKQMCSDGRYLGSGSYAPLEVLEDFNLAIKALNQEPKKGHWIDIHEYHYYNDGDIETTELRCSCCYEEVEWDIELLHKPYYCENCGAKMESE